MTYHGIKPIYSYSFSKEFLKGKIHWEWVLVAPMPKYIETITVSKELSAPVKDVNYNERFVEIGKFLYDTIQKNLKENEAHPDLVKSREIEK